MLFISASMFINIVSAVKYYKVEGNFYDTKNIFKNKHMPSIAVSAASLFLLGGLFILGDFGEVSVDAKEESSPFSKLKQELIENSEVPIYSELLSDKKKFEGKTLKLTGRIDQIIERDNSSIIMLNVYNKEGINDNTDIVYVEYGGNTNHVSGNRITVYGDISDNQVVYSSYVNESQSRYKFSVPAVHADILTE